MPFSPLFIPAFFVLDLLVGIGVGKFLNGGRSA